MVCDSPLYSFPFIVEFLPFSPGFELYNEEAIVERKFSAPRPPQTKHR